MYILCTTKASTKKEECKYAIATIEQVCMMFLHVLFFSTVHLGYWALCMFPYTSSTLLCIDMFSDVWSSTPFPSCLTVYQTLLKPSVRTWSRRASWKRCHIVKGRVVHLPDSWNTSTNMKLSRKFHSWSYLQQQLTLVQFFQDWPMTRWNTCQIFWIGWTKMTLWMSKTYVVTTFAGHACHRHLDKLVRLCG